MRKKTVKTQQMQRMDFSPDDCSKKPYPSQADQWRDYHGETVWFYNPWTGKARDARDIGSDTFGRLIIPPGENVVAGK